MTKNFKPRVLFISENVFLPTGYGNIGRELFPRLAEQFDFALLSCFGLHDDPRNKDLPYKVYDATPDPRDKLKCDEYKNNHAGKWGATAFEEACLDWRPTIVASFRDSDNDEFISRSPYRKFFRWVYQPTVDAAPQKDEWVELACSADAVLTYTNWGGQVLKSQGGDRLNWLGAATPGADYDVFKPVMDREAHKASFGLRDKFIIGTVGRSQSRKLFPDLIQAFNLFVRAAPPEIAAKSILYLHTGHPDMMGWDIPAMVKESGQAARTYFTYICHACMACYPSVWVGPNSHCRLCGVYAAQLSSSDFGVTRHDLAKVMNCFDVYCHLASCGGLEMPIVEAAACGLPILATDYAAMGEVTRAIGGTPLKPLSLQTEIISQRKVATSDVNGLVGELLAVANRPSPVRNHDGFMGALASRSTFTYDKMEAQWVKAIRSVPPALSWNLPKRELVVPDEPPGGLSDADFAEFCTSLLRFSIDAYSFSKLKICKELAYGGSRIAIWAQVREAAGVLSDWERIRVERVGSAKNISARHIS